MSKQFVTRSAWEDSSYAARRVLRQWFGVVLLFLTILHAAVIEAATPLQKIVFVFAGFNERSGFIFTAKAEELIYERIVRKLERAGALLR
jgi:hypothetical protein